jgi:peptidoglycan/xylan/chitin deacetylase (PgdA/CDA1 family)
LFLLYIHYLTSIQINCSSNYIFSFDNINSSNVSIFQDKIDSIYSSDEKIAFLTFDDGPTKIATPKVLDTLKENDVKASFFVIGYRVNEFPQIVKREYEEGHFVANHGYTHKNSKLYQNKDSFINEILDTDTAISEAIGVSNYHSHLFRFPNGSNGTSYASTKKKCKEYLADIGYCYVDWNALNNDSITKYSSYQLLNNLKATCKDKNSLIILMHDTSDVSKSYEALDDSIKFLKEQGYTFKTFQELLY